MPSAGVRLLAASLLGVLVGARAVTSCEQSSCEPVVHCASASMADDDAIAAYGLPSQQNVVRMRGYMSSVNYERRIPNWVMERIEYRPAKKKSSENDKDAVSRDGCKFYSDESVPEMFRATTSDYNRRGLSRGHMAPAQFHKASQEEMCETFNLQTNIVPQDMTMNACDWYRLESMTKKLAKEFEKGLWVLSGPLFVPNYDVSTGKRVVQYEVVGSHDVAVPTHLFKCLLGVKEDNRKYVSCFVMPNEPIPEERPLINYQVPPSYVERTAGLFVFPKATGGASWGASPPMDMCRKFTCEGSYAAFSKSFRNVGRLRAAASEAEVKRIYIQLFSDGAVDAAVEKELKAKLQELGVKDTSAYKLAS